MVSEHSFTVSSKPDPTLASELPKMSTETELAPSQCGQIDLQRSMKSLELAVKMFLQMVCEKFGLDPIPDDFGNQVDAIPEPQTDPQEHQEQRIEVIGNKGPKDLEKWVDPVVGSKSSDPVFGGSASPPTKQRIVKDDPDVHNISVEMIGLSSHPTIPEVINAKRSLLPEKISVKRYHKARKKARNHSAVPENKGSDRLRGRNLRSRMIPMKKRFDLGEKATQHKLELDYNNYGMCFGYPSSKNSRKSCHRVGKRCFDDNMMLENERVSKDWDRFGKSKKVSEREELSLQNNVWKPGGFISVIQQGVETVKGPRNRGDKHDTRELMFLSKKYGDGMAVRIRSRKATASSNLWKGPYQSVENTDTVTSRVVNGERDPDLSRRVTGDKMSRNQDKDRDLKALLDAFLTMGITTLSKVASLYQVWYVWDPGKVEIFMEPRQISDITQDRVSMAEDIFRRRQLLPSKDAIYFIQPIKENVIMLLSDKSGKPPLYNKSMVFFSSPFSKELVGSRLRNEKQREKAISEFLSSHMLSFHEPAYVKVKCHISKDAAFKANQIWEPGGTGCGTDTPSVDASSLTAHWFFSRISQPSVTSTVEGMERLYIHKLQTFEVLSLVRDGLRRQKWCLLRMGLKRDPRTFLLEGAVRWKQRETLKTVDDTAVLSTEVFSLSCKLSLGVFSLDFLAEQSCGLIFGEMEYNLKLKWVFDSQKIRVQMQALHKTVFSDGNDDEKEMVAVEDQFNGNEEWLIAWIASIIQVPLKVGDMKSVAVVVMVPPGCFVMLSLLLVGFCLVVKTLSGMDTVLSSPENRSLLIDAGYQEGKRSPRGIGAGTRQTWKLFQVMKLPRLAMGMKITITAFNLEDKVVSAGEY